VSIYYEGEKDMNKKRNSKFAIWFIFTFLFGTLPIILQVFASAIIGYQISVISLMKELFFLTIILCTDTLKTIYELKDKKVYFNKAFVHGVSIFILVIASVLYGIMLVSEEVKITKMIYVIPLYLCVFSLIMGMIVQLLSSREDED